MGKKMVLAGLPREAGLLILLISLSFVLVVTARQPPRKFCQLASPEAADPYPGECGRFGAPSRTKRRTPYIVGGQPATWGQIPWQVRFAIYETKQPFWNRSWCIYSDQLHCGDVISHDHIFSLVMFCSRE